jgi:hypothetical protein
MRDAIRKHLGSSKRAIPSETIPDEGRHQEALRFVQESHPE